MDLQSLPEWARYMILSAVIGALAMVFRDALVALLKRLAQTMSALLGRWWADRFFERRYLKWIGMECQRSTLIGVIPAEPGRQLALPNVFVVPTFSERLVMPRLGTLEDRFGFPEGPEEATRPLSPGEALDRRTTVILGEPGFGKSTLLHFLALAYVGRIANRPYRERLGIRPERRVPMLIPLLEFASSEDSLPVFAEEHVARRSQGVLQPPPGYLERLSRQGRCLFLLDGLDEVLGLGDKSYRKVCDAVNALAAVEDKNRFVVTSRIAGWRGMLSHDFAPVYIEPFDEPRQREFVEMWYQAVEASAVTGRESSDEANIRRRRAQDRAGDFVREVKANDRLRRLATNPLLLSVMALVHRRGMLPLWDRVKLYGQCAELLLESRDVGRGVADRWTTDLTLGQKEALMCHVAHHFHENGRRFGPRRVVETLMAELLPSLGQPAGRAGELLSWVERRTGLLTNGEHLTFAHLGFQEYFTAQAALYDPALRESLLQPDRLLDPWWREVVLLYAGAAGDATDFVRRIYSPEEDDFLRRRLFLAGRCAGEAACMNEDLRKEIRDALLQVWRETPFSKQRKEALAALAVQPSKEVTDHFVTALKNEEIKVRRRAAWALAELRVKRPDVANALLEAMKDEDARVRKSAASALGQLEVAEDRVVNALLGALKDENEGVRQGAAWGLGRLGMADEIVTSALWEALQDRDRRVGQNAAGALQRLGVLNQRMVSSLVEALKDTEAERRAFAAEVLGRIQAKEAQVIRVLLEAMKDEDPAVRANATSALSELGAEEEQVVKALLEALKDEDSVVRGNAAEALGELGMTEGRVVKALLEALMKSQEAIVRARAAWGLAELGVKEEGVVNALLEVIEDEDAGVRKNAVSALGELGVAEERIVNALLEALKDQEAGVRQGAAWALGRLGVAEEQVIKALLEALKDKDSVVRRNAAKALGRLGMVEERMVSALLEALMGEDTREPDRVLEEVLWELSERQGLWIGRDGTVRKLRG